MIVKNGWRPDTGANAPDCEHVVGLRRTQGRERASGRARRRRRRRRRTAPEEARRRRRGTAGGQQENEEEDSRRRIQASPDAAVLTSEYQASVAASGVLAYDELCSCSTSSKKNGGQWWQSFDAHTETDTWGC